MLPPQSEYFFILSVYCLAIVSLFAGTLQRVARQRHFWIGMFTFFTWCTVLDYVAISLRWWNFPVGRLLGLGLVGIPIEEYCLFVLAYVLVVASWEFVINDMD